MVVNKRKKNSRLSGSHTHGWGAMKKHRGSGNKGGAGRAGSGKRADSKKPSTWKNRLFGKYGFVSKGTYKDQSAINILTLEQSLPSLIAAKKVTVSKDVYTINLKDVGVAKLLSRGKATHKFSITCSEATPRAIERVEAAGGTVIQEGKNGSEGGTAKSS